VSAQSRLLISIDSEFLAVLQPIFLILHARSLNLSHSLSSIGASHTLLPLGGLKHGNSSQLILFLLNIAA